MLADINFIINKGDIFICICLTPVSDLFDYKPGWEK